MLNFDEYRTNALNNKIIENPGERHLACVVLIDTSGSMENSMDQLHEGLYELGAAIKEDDYAVGITEFCIMTFNDKPSVVMPFGPAYDYEAPAISCGGSTAMHLAVDAALNEVEARKAQYKENKTSYYRPWIFMLTDGKTNDADNGVFERLIDAQNEGKCIFFPVGIGNGADYTLLKRLKNNGLVLKANRDNFKNSFEWLSSSISMVSRSSANQQVKLDDPLDYQLSVVV